MTAVCAVVASEKVWMGADSAGVSGLSLRKRADSKVFVNGPFVMGFTTSFRMGQLLRWNLVAPRHHAEDTDEKFMSTTFVDAVRQTLKTGGWARKDNEMESGGNFLVGYRGRIWEVQGDYQVGLPLDDFASVGCGEDLCLGSLHATPTLGPEERIMTALEAAERFSAGVRAPFTIVREP